MGDVHIGPGQLCIGDKPPTMNAIGDEYDKKFEIPDKFKGKQVVTGPAKQAVTANPNPAVWAGGKTQNLFLSEGDKYVDPGALERLAQREARKKTIGGEKAAPWKGTKPAAKLASPGNDLWGASFRTMDKSHPDSTTVHYPEFPVERRGENRKKIDRENKSPKNFAIKLSPRGGPGFMNTGIGPDPRYMSDPYSRRETAERDQHKKVAEAHKDLAPLKLTSRPKGLFSGNEIYAPVPVFISTKQAKKAKAAEKTEGGEGGEGEKKKEKKHESGPAKPWSPSWHHGPAGVTRTPWKAMDGGAFTYVEDPMDLQLKAEREEKAKFAREGPQWKPLNTTMNKAHPFKAVGPVS